MMSLKNDELEIMLQKNKEIENIEETIIALNNVIKIQGNEIEASNAETNDLMNREEESNLSSDE